MHNNKFITALSIKTIGNKKNSSCNHINVDEGNMIIDVCYQWGSWEIHSWIAER